MELSKFKSLGVNDEIVEALGFMGITEPTKIQENSIPIIIEGRDLIACSQTGTGKTASFLIPILQNCLSKASTDNYALIICPTRELALQIDQQFDAIAYFSTVSSTTLYGGGDANGFVKEKAALESGVNIIIGTPGKVLSHLNLNREIGKKIEVFVLDEADRMLDMGFVDAINRIVSFMPNRKQNLMFSATMPPTIRSLANNILKDPAELSYSISKPAEKINQRAVSIVEDDKVDYLLKWYKETPDLNSIIIFSATKAGAKFISYKFQSAGLSAKSLHSDKTQSEREEIMRQFKAKQVKILIATNIASRGIDVEDIDVVVNYHVPDEAEDYVHRVGRTARAKKSGEAITLVSPREQRKWVNIQKLIEKEIVFEMPEGFRTPTFDRNNLPKGGGNFRGNKNFSKGKSKRKGSGKPFRKKEA